ncbi:MAG: DNA translocase FtsK 4TM domain-containing protein, partial [Gemmataceae bacterium]|nr:DNA translocase FtsK 4TM domain-containing protein [Gemmataceae bacterium]
QYELPGATSKNPLGSMGTWISSTFFRFLGLSSFFILGTWFTLVFGLLLRNHPFTWILRLAGWLTLIPAASVIATMNQEFLPLVSPAGSGGSLGSLLFLESRNIIPEWMIMPIAIVVALAASFLALPAVWNTLGIGLRFALTNLLKLLVSITRLLGSILQLSKKLIPIKAENQIDASKSESKVFVIEKPAVKPRVKNQNKVEDGIPIFHHEKFNAKQENKVASALLVNTTSEKYELPPMSLLEDPKPLAVNTQEQDLRDRAVLLEKTFLDFGLNIKVVGINTGPVITQFELALETGLRVNKVTRLNDDISLNLKVPSVRIVAPIPGKNTVGVEIPNEIRAEVRLKEVLQSTGPRLKSLKIPLFLGKDSEGRPLVYDLADMPHLLIAGSTGTGKSVCMNTIILSMLMTRTPDEIKMIMIDPKVVELSNFTKIPHMMHPVVHDMKKAEAILSWAVEKMEERYELLRRAKVRNIASYNELGGDEVIRRVEPAEGEDRSKIPSKMPYIVIFIDEMADLMMTMKKEVETHIIRLAQKSRAAGIHLIVATQKPTVDVITGLIKSNMPARICFKVVNKSDSRVVLDEMGADKLLGKGDMLFLPPGTSILVRAQGTFASDREISNIVENLEGDPCYAQELMQLETKEDDSASKDLAEKLRSRDDLYEAAVEVVIREGRGSVSLLQRSLGVGYGRAARLIDFMAEDGIVGTYNGSSAREVVMSPEQWESMRALRQTAGSR